MIFQDRIDLRTDAGVAHVTLARADKMNALDMAMFDAIVEVGEALRADASVRAVVLSGQGKAFCAGLDVSNFADMAAGDGGDVARDPLAKRTHGASNKPQYAAMMWRELPVPVIAAVHGVAYGGGLQVCLGADIRYAAADTRFSVMEIKWGLVPDMGGTQLLRHLARDDVIRELTYTGRVFDAAEAVQLGLVTKVCDDPLAAAVAVAEEIAGRNPDAVRASKRLLNQAPYVDMASGLVAESVEQDAIIGSPNQIEAVMASMEKRAGRFTDAGA
ncbi:MAG: crotonase/enoyl-CoA hydratase family protein [Halieaceae bacterium]|jgi:enoyl-CoA hydratase/carnithine racemase|nr:crotonase/enoyl-CoA hydratase family protein [Halieaceae bacterium]